MGLFINIDPFLIKIGINKVRDSIRKKKTILLLIIRRRIVNHIFIQIKNKIKNSDITF
jgi:hypothetical protein